MGSEAEIALLKRWIAENKIASHRDEVVQLLRRLEPELAGPAPSVVQDLATTAARQVFGRYAVPANSRDPFCHSLALLSGDSEHALSSVDQANKAVLLAKTELRKKEEDLKQAVLAASRKGVPMTHLAKRIAVSRQTLHEWLNKKPAA